MIASFRCTETEKIFKGKQSLKFGHIQRVAFRKLVLLNAAERLSDLAGVGTALEALKADRAGRYAIRVNDQYRICFSWSEGSASAVEIVDYH